MKGRWPSWWALVVVVGASACGGGGMPGGRPLDTAAGRDAGEEVAEAVETLGANGENLTGQDDVPEGGDVVAAEVPWGEGPGHAGWPCSDNQECYSGFCIETPGGKVCTKLCGTGGDCPQGYECAQVATTPDVMYACVHPAPRMCRPCRTDGDCEAAYASTPMACKALEGRYFCLVACGGDARCPEGTQCEAGVGRGGGEVCVPEGGACGCASGFVGIEGACEVTSPLGTCLGTFVCEEEGPSECQGGAAEAEVCNGLDDDCDGQTDEVGDLGGCTVTNVYGSCPGAKRCVGGQEVCEGPYAAPEVCNGVDDDCDGQTDEGFSDADLDGMADCVDEDQDGDGVTNGQDNCPEASNPDQSDCDGDGKGDACDPDDDNDGVANYVDNCLCVKNTDQKDMDGDGRGDACDDDVDGDGVANEDDNCAGVSNPDQSDCEGDGVGDACDLDDDNDGVVNASDNCRCLANPDQKNTDGDLQGDACDPDDDNDGIADGEDNCPWAANGDQGDQDGDGLGDGCDCDVDGDGVYNSGVDAAGNACAECAPCDNCPGTYNPEQTDLNENGVGDDCEQDWDGDGVWNDDDNCPWVANKTQADLDLDGVGDACDCDVDGDGAGNQNPGCPAPSPADNCPLVVNPGQEDLDGDGQGDACDGDWDGDGDGNESDCAPRDPWVFHGQTEVCNGVDDDCDGEVDEEGSQGCVGWYYDGDGDGYGVTLLKCLCGPSGAYQATKAGDCDDLDGQVYPGQAEVCNNGRDDNCNGSENDEDAVGCVVYYQDLDSDGYGTGEGTCLCFSVGGRTATMSGDCDDQDPQKSPGREEKCLDQKDNDCDGETDEEGCQGCTTYFRDEDQDGYGVTSDKRCLGAPQYPYTAYVGQDCDDQNASVRPGALEMCNGLDDNCDQVVDPVGTQGCQNLYPDADGDGYGALNQPALCYCAPTGIYRAPQSGDCLDSDALVNPAAVEECDGRDNNCNGQVDEGLLQTFFKDQDGDGYGLAGDSKALCGPQPPYAASQSGDCDDQDPERYPGHPEVCDGKDNNCNGQVDEGVSKTFYRDQDGDGFGTSMSVQGCSAPPGYVEEGGDCNDLVATIHPGAPEQCNDVDDNCNGFVDDGLPTQIIYKDNDGDGFAASNAPSRQKCDVPTGWTTKNNPPDCDDTDITVYPGATDLCDGKDNDCNGFKDTTCPQVCAGDWPVYLGPSPLQTPVLAADLNNDLQLEVIAVSRNDANQRWVLNARGEKVVSLSQCGTWPYGLNIVQLDARPDFQWDVVCKNAVYDYDGLRVVLPGSPYNTPAIGDVTGDGVPDIVVGTWSAKYLVHRGAWDAAGRWVLATTHELALSSAGLARSLFTPTLVDLDGDGVQDIIAGSGYRSDAEGDYPDGRIYAWRYDGAAFVRYCPLAPQDPDQCFATGQQFWWTGKSLAVDWDLDGDIEIVFPENGGYIFNHWGQIERQGFDGFPLDINRDGQFEFGVPYWGWNWGDFDRDGTLERQNTNQLAEQNGQALPGWPIQASATDRWPGVVADLDGDGRVEVVFADSQYVACYTLGEGSDRPEDMEWYGAFPFYRNPFGFDGQMDSYEPQNDHPDRAPILAGWRGGYFGYLWRTGDEDFFRLPVFGYWTEYVLRLSVPEGVDYDLVVTNADQTFVACQSTNGPGQKEQCTASAAHPGVDFKGYFLVHILAKNGSDHHTVRPYRLTWEKNAY